MRLSEYRFFIILFLFFIFLSSLYSEELNEDISLLTEEALLYYSRENYAKAEELSLQILEIEPDNAVANSLVILIKEKKSEIPGTSSDSEKEDLSEIKSGDTVDSEFIYTKDREKEEQIQNRNRYFFLDVNPFYDFLMTNGNDPLIPDLQPFMPSIDCNLDYWMESFNHRLGLYSSLLLPLSELARSDSERDLNGNFNMGVQINGEVFQLGNVLTILSVGYGLSFFSDSGNSEGSMIIPGSQFILDLSVPISSYFFRKNKENGFIFDIYAQIFFFSEDETRSRFSSGGVLAYRTKYWKWGISASYLSNQNNLDREQLVRIGLNTGFTP